MKPQAPLEGENVKKKATKKLTLEQRRAIYCVKNGHSRLRTFCFGYHHCARCGQQLGDSLGGAYTAADGTVYLSHLKGKKMDGCPCRENVKKLRRSDLALVARGKSSPCLTARSEARDEGREGRNGLAGHRERSEGRDVGAE